MSEQRRLAAIVSADVAGYSRLMGRDESGTLAALKALRREVVDPRVAKHNGRIVKTTGDGLLLEFASVVDAVRCVIAVQTAVAEKTADLPQDRRIAFRIGVNIGDIIGEGDDIFGDGVNVAARLQAIARPGGVCLSGRVHDEVCDRLDLALQDGGRETLKNIARPVPVWHWMPGQAPQPAQVARTLARKPALAVLPFANLSCDPEQEYFADGVTEDILAALSRFRDLVLSSRSSSFSFKHKNLPTIDIARQLGVHYVLSGSLRRSQGRIRVAAELTNAESGLQVWADRYDRELADIFDVQEDIGRSVAAVVDPAVRQAEIERARRQPAENLSAYDLYLRALPHMWVATREQLPKAIELLHQSVNLEPRSAPAMAALAWCLIMAPVVGAAFAGDSAGEALDLSRRAVEQDPGDAFAQAIYGQALALITGDCVQGQLHAEEAVRLNPSSAFAWSAMGFVGDLAGDFKAAIDSFQLALRLSPSDSFLYWWMTGLAAAQFALGRYEEAIASARSAVQRHPSFGSAHRLLAASLAMAGRLDDARDVTQRRDRVQTTTLREIGALRLFRQDEVMERYLAAQRLCGVAE